MKGHSIIYGVDAEIYGWRIFQAEEPMMCCWSLILRSFYLTNSDDRRLTQDDGEVLQTLDDGVVSQTLDDWRVTKTQDDWRVLIINHVTIVTGCVSRVDDIYMADFFFCWGRISMYHVMWWLDHSFLRLGRDVCQRSPKTWRSWMVSVGCHVTWTITRDWWWNLSLVLTTPLDSVKHWHDGISICLIIFNAMLVKK